MITTLNSNHRIMRMMSNSLVITDCYFEFNLDVLPGVDKSKQAELITRMKLWLDSIFENCVAMPMNTIADIDWLANLENSIMFAPDKPNDFLIQVLVHAKLHAIGAGLVGIASSHLVTDQSNGFGIWFDGNPDELLPAQKDWMGERCYYALPWWHRGDAGMMDVIAEPEDDITEKPDIIVDWYAIMEAKDGDNEPKRAEIIRPNFRPRIVTDD